MTNTELTKIREEKNLSKRDFAKLLGITPMLLGKYEKGSCKIPDSLKEKLAAVSDEAAATEIEVKKETRKAARNAKEKIEEAIADVKEAVEEQAIATEIEVKKTARKAAKTVKETVDAAAASDKAGVPTIIIQSPLGGYIKTEDILKKVPANTEDVYVRVDENKLYYVLEDGQTGDVNIWD